jgi:hypothetical protein
LSIVAKLLLIRHAVDDVPRSTTRHARASVDLRSHGPALNAIARSMHMSVSAVVRMVLAEWLENLPAEHADRVVDAIPPRLADVVKVTVRLPAGQAHRLARVARAAELSQGAFLARLIDSAPLVSIPADLREGRVALLRSTATLAAISSDLQALLRVLRHASSPEQARCHAAVALLSDAVLSHLALAAQVIAELKPSRGRAAGDRA